jgi:hypothetical protein
LINIVCENALIAGYATDLQIIDQKTVGEIIDSREGLNSKKNRKRVIRMIVLVFLALLAALLGWFWFKGQNSFNFS